MAVSSCLLAVGCWLLVVVVVVLVIVVVLVLAVIVVVVVVAAMQWLAVVVIPLFQALSPGGPFVHLGNLCPRARDSKLNLRLARKF